MSHRAVLLLDTISSLGGGIPVAVRGLTKALIEQGEAVRVVARDDGPTKADRSQWAGTDVCLSSHGGVLETVFARRLATTLSAGSVDLVHLHGIWGVAARAATIVDNGPLILSPHGMLDPWARNRSRAKKAISSLFWEDKLFKRAAAIHALNSAEADAIRSSGFSGRIEVIPNGVDLPDSVPSAGYSLQKRHEKRTLLFLGRLHPKKGLSELVAAWAKTSLEVRRSWQLKIVGWDQIGMRIGLEQQAIKAGIGGEIIFTGPVHGTDKEAVFDNADAFVLPSRSEGLPMAVLEAWAHHLPVFMTKECNLPEGFSAKAAVRVPVEPDPLAKILSDRLLRFDSLSVMGANGRKLVENEYGWAAVARSMMSLYHDCTPRGPQRV